ncbi:MAG: MlaD family protein [Planctomycetota bacterium]
MSASTELKVGSFVIASAALALGGVIALGSGSLFKETALIETSTTDSVDGLQVGSPVKYRGVPIGEVAAIAFADRYYPDEIDADKFDFASPVVIRMKVRLDVFGPQKTEVFTKDLESGVARGLRARMSSAGLTGGLFVELDLVDPTLFPARELAYRGDVPHVPSAPSKLNELITSVERITRNLAEVDFSSIGSKLATTIDGVDGMVRNRVDPMMVSARAFIDDLKGSNARMRQILDDPSIERTMAAVASLTGDLSDAVHPNAQGLREGLAEIPTLLKSAREASQKLEALVGSPQVARILEGLEDTTGRLGPTVEEYRMIGAQVSEFLERESYELRQLIGALRQTAQNLESLSGAARRDPAQVLFGKPPAPIDALAPAGPATPAAR